MRIECRVGGADLNPYLAFAAQIAAGIDGIERELELEEEFRGDAYGADRGGRSPRRCARRRPSGGIEMLREALAQMSSTTMSMQRTGSSPSMIGA